MAIAIEGAGTVSAGIPTDEDVASKSKGIGFNSGSYVSYDRLVGHSASAAISVKGYIIDFIPLGIEGNNIAI